MHAWCCSVAWLNLDFAIKFCYGDMFCYIIDR